MDSIKVRLADMCIEIRYRYPHTEKICRDYITDDDEPAILSVMATDEDIAEEERESIRLHGQAFTPGYLESVCIYRNLCRKLPVYDVFFLHAAVISDGDGAYAFSAPSGTGKSTHILQWQKAFGDVITVVNGDKPLIRHVGGEWRAYGTPWCGKEGLNTNTSERLRGICFIERGTENVIERLDLSAAADRVMRQVIIPPEPDAAIAMLGMVDGMIKEIPVWLLRCNISTEAAKVARDAMRGAELL